MSDEAQHGQETDDLWAWIDQVDDVQDVADIEAESVTAIMVVRNAEAWLPRQLLSLTRLDPRPGRIIGVDAGSTDGSLSLLEMAAEEGVLDVALEASGDGFGKAVAAALGQAQPEWIWLLHDDSAPHPDALGALLEGAKRADIVVPKLLQPKRRNYKETLSEIGQAITAGGIRVPLVEEGDADQQQDESRDVLGASTAGLLIRGSAWQELDGFAPQVQRFRDGLDLCWRANAIGYRVLTWPSAALNHQKMGANGQRAESEHPQFSDRLAALRVVGARGASTIGLGIASYARAFGFLLAKAPKHGAAELAAFSRYRKTRTETAELAARLPEEDLTPAELLPSRGWPISNALDRVGAGISERYRELSDSTTSIDELTSDDEFVPASGRRRILSPIPVLIVALVLAGVLAGRSLLGTGAVAGGGLLPAPATWSSAWQAYLTGEASWQAFGAVLPLFGFGFPGIWTLLALILAPLAAAWAAMALLRRLEVPAGKAVAFSAAWAAATLLLGLVTAGDVSGLVLASCGPLLARSLLSVHRDESEGAERLRAPAGAAFWLVVVVVVWPVALIVASLAALLVVVRDRQKALTVALIVAPAWLFILFWLPTLVRYPGRLLTGVDPLAWPDFPPASYALVIGRILPSGLPLWVNLAFFAVLGGLAVVAIARLSFRQGAIVLGLVAAPLLIGTLLSRILVSVPGGSARVLLSPWALLVVAALLAAILLPKPARFADRMNLIALCLVAALAVGSWAWVGFNGAVSNRQSVLPGFVQDVLNSPRDTSALLIEQSSTGEIAWNVVNARQPQWGTGERALTGSFASQFAALAPAIAAATPPADLAERFQELGVSHLLLRGFERETTAVLDNTEGLEGHATDEKTTVWTVSGLVSAVTADGVPVVDGVVPVGVKRLTIAQPAATNWRASVDGQRLTAADPVSPKLLGEPVVTFEGIPESGGSLRSEPAQNWWQFWLQLIVVLALTTLAAPSLGGSAVARRGQA